MADLIDREALRTDIENAVVFSGRPGRNAEICGANKITARIDAAPAVDAVPVVRCRDCRHKTEHPMGGHAVFCEVWAAFNGMGDEGFCNYGEREEE